MPAPVDVIADMHFDKAHVLVNADFGIEKINDAGDKNTWYGANATLGYAMTDMFAIAAARRLPADFLRAASPLVARGAGTGKSKVIDATLTLAATPTPNLIIKLEPRIDSFDNDFPGYAGVYTKGSGRSPCRRRSSPRRSGMVVTTN